MGAMHPLDALLAASYPSQEIRPRAPENPDHPVFTALAHLRDELQAIEVTAAEACVTRDARRREQTRLRVQKHRARNQR